MKITWQDLNKPKNLFTVRNATSIDLNTKKIVQHYSTNTKIQVVQDCYLNDTHYYRTQSSKDQNLDWAFEATAFGEKPTEKAPSAPELECKTFPESQTQTQTMVLSYTAPEDGGAPKKHGFWKKLFKKP